MKNANIRFRSTQMAKEKSHRTTEQNNTIRHIFPIGRIATRFTMSFSNSWTDKRTSRPGAACVCAYHRAEAASNSMTTEWHKCVPRCRASFTRCQMSTHDDDGNIPVFSQSYECAVLFSVSEPRGETIFVANVLNKKTQKKQKA